MNSHQATPEVVGRSAARSSTHLRGRTLLLARAAWLLLAVIIIMLIGAGVPFEYAHYKGICAGAACATDLGAQLTPEGVQALQALGLSAGFYAAYNVTLEV